MACDLQGILLSFKYPSKYYFGLKYFFQVFFFAFLSNSKQRSKARSLLTPLQVEL